MLFLHLLLGRDTERTRREVSNPIQTVRMVNQFGTVNRNRELQVWVSKLATLIMISSVMTAAAAVLMDEDLVCSVQVDQRSSADRLAAIDRTLQGWSLAVLTS